jgi:transcription initiation factor IIE alpha subunit
MEQTKNDNLSLIKCQLEKGKRITSISVLKSIGTTEIRHYLSKLRKEGLAIKDRWIEKDGKHFKEWFL